MTGLDNTSEQDIHVTATHNLTALHTCCTVIHSDDITVTRWACQVNWHHWADFQKCHNSRPIVTTRLPTPDNNGRHSAQQTHSHNSDYQHLTITADIQHKLQYNKHVSCMTDVHTSEWLSLVTVPINTWIHLHHQQLSACCLYTQQKAWWMGSSTHNDHQITSQCKLLSKYKQVSH